MAFLNDDEIERIMYKCYKITNLINGKIYIGQTKKTLEQRLKEHYRTMQRGSKYAIHRAIRKYGIENFKIELLFEFDTKKKCNNKEIELISENNSMNKDIGYNMCRGGEGGGLSKNHPDREQIIKKMSDDGKERFRQNQQLLQKLLDGSKNIPEEKRKEMVRKSTLFQQQPHIRQAKRERMLGEKNYQYGKKHTPETRKKISIAVLASGKTKNFGENNPAYKNIDLEKLKELSKIKNKKQLCEIFNITKQTLDKKLKIINIDEVSNYRRPYKNQQENHVNFISIDIDKLISLSHLRISELVKIFNVSRQTITRRLQKLGLKK